MLQSHFAALCIMLSQAPSHFTPRVWKSCLPPYNSNRLTSYQRILQARKLEQTINMNIVPWKQREWCCICYPYGLPEFVLCFLTARIQVFRDYRNGSVYDLPEITTCLNSAEPFILSFANAINNTFTPETKQCSYPNGLADASGGMRCSANESKVTGRTSVKIHLSCSVPLSTDTRRGTIVPTVTSTSVKIILTTLVHDTVQSHLYLMMN